MADGRGNRLTQNLDFMEFENGDDNVQFMDKSVFLSRLACTLTYAFTFTFGGGTLVYVSV